MHPLRALTDLIEIILVCIPLYVILFGLEIMFDRIWKFLVDGGFERWVATRLVKAKSQEHDRWEQRAHDIDVRDDDQ